MDISKLISNTAKVSRAISAQEERNKLGYAPEITPIENLGVEDFSSGKIRRPEEIISPMDKDGAVEMAIKDLQNQASVPSDYVRKYREAGITYNPAVSDSSKLDVSLSEVQSAWTKIGNSLAQTLVSELLLGTAKGLSDLFDMVGQAVGWSDHDYSNPVSKKLEDWQEQFRNYAPIHADPDVHLSSGGLNDVGWWASNAPSIISSLTLLLPSVGIVKGLSWLGKIKVPFTSNSLFGYTRGAIRGLSGASRRLHRAEEMSKLGFTAEEIAQTGKYANLNKFQTWINSANTINRTNMLVENTMTAAMSRAMENYQESRQTYTNMLNEAREKLNGMSDEEYFMFLQNNPDIRDNEDIDIDDKEAVAKHIAGRAADRTFAMDWFNVIFDVHQMYALKNIGKMLRSSSKSSAAIRQAERDAKRFAGRYQTMDELKALRKTELSRARRFGEGVYDRVMASKNMFLAEANEGIEEAVNYIAQEEGNLLGKTMLATNDELKEGKFNRNMIENWYNGFDKRGWMYLQAPELWDSAFWGVMGGVVFQAGGNRLNRIRNTYFSDEKKANEAAVEENSKNMPWLKRIKDREKPWWKLNMSPEIQRRIEDIHLRANVMHSFRDNLNLINNGKNIYASKNADGSYQTFSSEVEKENAIKRNEEEFIKAITLSALNSGNYDMLKSFIEDENVQNAMVRLGYFEHDRQQKAKELANKIRNNAEQYEAIKNREDVADGLLSEDVVIEEMIRPELEQHMKKTVEDYVQNLTTKMQDIASMYDKELINLSHLAAHLKTPGNIPIEYMQIMAANNLSFKRQNKLLSEEEARVDKRIGELTTELINNGGIDSSIDYQGNIRTAMIANELGILRANRKILNSKKDKTLSDILSLQNIEKQIDSLESQLTGGNLVWATMMSLRYSYDANGKLMQFNTNEYNQYYNDMIVQNVDGERAGVKVENDVYKELGLSETARTLLNSGEIGKFQYIKGISRQVFQDLRNVSPELNSLMQQKVSIEFTRRNNEISLVNNRKDFESNIAMLNNTMDEARVKAIENAMSIIKRLYDAHPTLKFAIYDYLTDYTENVPKEQRRLAKQDLKNLDEKEREDLEEALKILDIASAENRGLIVELDDYFDKEEMMKELKESYEAYLTMEEDEDVEKGSEKTSETKTDEENEENEPKSIIGGIETDTNSEEAINKSFNDIVEGDKGLIENDNKTTYGGVRTQTSKYGISNVPGVVVTPFIGPSYSIVYDNGEVSEVKGEAENAPFDLNNPNRNEEAIPLYQVQGDSTLFQADVMNRVYPNPQTIQDETLFDNDSGEVDFLSPVEITAPPIFKRTLVNGKSKFEVVERGKIRNKTNASEEQKAQAEQQKQLAEKQRLAALSEEERKAEEEKIRLEAEEAARQTELARKQEEAAEAAAKAAAEKNKNGEVDNKNVEEPSEPENNNNSEDDITAEAQAQDKIEDLPNYNESIVVTNPEGRKSRMLKRDGKLYYVTKSTSKKDGFVWKEVPENNPGWTSFIRTFTALLNERDGVPEGTAIEDVLVLDTRKLPHFNEARLCGTTTSTAIVKIDGKYYYTDITPLSNVMSAKQWKVATTDDEIATMKRAYNEAPASNKTHQNIISVTAKTFEELPYRDNSLPIKDNYFKYGPTTYVVMKENGRYYVATVNHKGEWYWHEISLDTPDMRKFIEKYEYFTEDDTEEEDILPEDCEVPVRNTNSIRFADKAVSIEIDDVKMTMIEHNGKYYILDYAVNVDGTYNTNMVTWVETQDVDFIELYKKADKKAVEDPTKFSARTSNRGNLKFINQAIVIGNQTVLSKDGKYYVLSYAVDEKGNVNKNKVTWREVTNKNAIKQYEKAFKERKALEVQTDKELNQRISERNEAVPEEVDEQELKEQEYDEKYRTGEKGKYANPTTFTLESDEVNTLPYIDEALDITDKNGEQAKVLLFDGKFYKVVAPNGDNTKRTWVEVPADEVYEGYREVSDKQSEEHFNSLFNDKNEESSEEKVIVSAPSDSSKKETETVTKDDVEPSTPSTQKEVKVTDFGGSEITAKVDKVVNDDGTVDYFMINDKGNKTKLDIKDETDKLFIDAYNGVKNVTQKQSISSTGEETDAGTPNFENVLAFRQYVAQQMQEAFRNNTEFNEERLIALGLSKGYRQEEVEAAIRQYKAIFERFKAKQAGQQNNQQSTMQSTVDELIVNQNYRLSTVTEERIELNPFVEAYKKAVNDMVKAYIKEKGFDKINNKYYINLEDLLRYVNEQTQDKSTAEAIYHSLKEYLKSEEARKEIIMMDDQEVDKKDFLDNVNKSATERLKEKCSTDITIRCDIDKAESLLRGSATDQSEIDRAERQISDALFALNKGDKLTYTRSDHVLELKNSDGNVVACLSVPEIYRKNGTFKMYVRGWEYDINRTSSSVPLSEIKEYFLNILLGTKNADYAELKGLLYELAFESVADKDTENARQADLINKIKANRAYRWAEGIYYEKGDTARDAARIQHLASIFKYVGRISQTPSIISMDKTLKMSINEYFNRVLKNWETTYEIANAGQSKVITVEEINAGQIIRVVPKNAGQEIEKLPMVQDAIAGGVKPEVHKVGYAGADDIGTITLSELGKFPLRRVTMGSTFLAIPAKNGMYDYVQAFPVPVTNDAVGKDVKEMVAAIREAILGTDGILERLSRKLARRQAIEDLYEILSNTTFGTRGLFEGLGVKYKQGKLQLSIKNTDTIVNIFTGETSSKGVMTDKVYYMSGEKKEKYSYNSQEVREFFESIFENLSAKVNWEYINSDSHETYPMRGFASKVDGKFVVTIGDKTWTYNSYNEFLLKNNLLRVNTQINPKTNSNFVPYGPNQKANRRLIIRVSDPQTNTSPVEESNAEGAVDSTQTPTTDLTQTPAPNPVNLDTKSLYDRVEAVLSSSSEKKGDDILDILEGAVGTLTKENVEALKRLELLPKKIIFDKNFNTKKGNETANAEIDLKTKTVTVGTVWMDLLKNPATRERAIRVLIHEQLHYKLSLSKGKGVVDSVVGIMNEFIEANNNDGLADNDHIRDFEFRKIKDAAERVEEFLIESLTNRDLIARLNEIDAKGYNKKTSRNLWKRLFEALAKIFGWNVRENSLYEKELYSIRQIFDNKSKKKSNEKVEMETETGSSDVTNQNTDVDNIKNPEIESQENNEEPNSNPETGEDDNVEIDSEIEEELDLDLDIEISEDELNLDINDDTETKVEEESDDDDIFYALEDSGLKFSTVSENTRQSSVTEESISKEVRALRNDAQKFLDNFGITINELNNYKGDVELFDALNRAINPRTADDITEGVGYAIAFMMQHSPLVNELISLKLKSNPVALKAIRRSIKNRGEFFILENKKLVNSVKSDEAIRNIGRDIAAELRNLYNIKLKTPRNSYIQQIWDIIASFFEKITPGFRSTIEIIGNNTRRIVEAVMLNDPSIILSNMNKPGSNTEAKQVSIEEALRNNPYEEDIVTRMGKYDISLGGSISMALEGTIYRPAENPLHDLDFESLTHNSEEIRDIVNKEFKNNQFVRSIIEGEARCDTYLVLDRPFYTKKGTVLDKNGKPDAVMIIYDAKTNIKIGHYVKSNLVLKEGIQGKFLDFFCGTNKRFPNKKVTLNGKKYLIADYRNAMEAKIAWGRNKDIWDYNRYLTHEQKAELDKAKKQSEKELYERFEKADIIWGHPAIGKTYYIEQNPDKFLEWDAEINPKRNAFIRDKVDPEHKMDTNSEEYKRLKSGYLGSWRTNQEYKDFLKNEWENLKARAKQENKKIIASPLPLLGMFREDFDLVIAQNDRLFMERNIQRGGEYYGTRGWKANIDEQLVKVDKSKLFYIEDYFSDFMDKHAASIEDAKHKSKGVYQSSVIEVASNIPSIPQFKEMLPVSQRAKFTRLVSDGHLSVSCK